MLDTLMLYGDIPHSLLQRSNKAFVAILPLAMREV